MHACLIFQLCWTLCNLMDCSPPGSSVHGDSPGKNPGVGCHFLLQAVFPTQELNPRLLCFLHCRRILYPLNHLGFPGGSDSKESSCNAGDLGSILGWGRSRGGHGNPLQYSCLENPMDRGTWRAAVHAIAKNQTPLSD